MSCLDGGSLDWPQGDNSWMFGTRVLMSSNFLRPTNNQTEFLKDHKKSAVHPKFSDRKENLGK